MINIGVHSGQVRRKAVIFTAAILAAAYLCYSFISDFQDMRKSVRDAQLGMTVADIKISDVPGAQADKARDCFKVRDKILEPEACEKAKVKLALVEKKDEQIQANKEKAMSVAATSDRSYKEASDAALKTNGKFLFPLVGFILSAFLVLGLILWAFKSIRKEIEEE